MKFLEKHPSLVPLYFAAVFLILLVINRATIDFAGGGLGWHGKLFILNAYLGYNFMYLFPAMLLTWLAGRPWLWRLLPWREAAGSVRIAVALLGGGLTTLFFFANQKLFELYGMFVNGFVINLIVTPGGIESLGGSDASNLGFALIGLGFIVGNVLLLLALHFLLERFDPACFQPRKLGKILLMVYLASTLTDRFSYAYADATGKSELMTLTQGVPYYTGLTMRTFLGKLGIDTIRQQKMISIKGTLNYPLNPIKFETPKKPYNIVWLVAESWRADTLNPEIMPRTWEFAQQAQHFKLNYSTGNGTRNGVFGMMTGIPGSYWEHFIQAQRSAPIIDVLQAQNYQMSLYSSAHFSYPEFDRTIFSKVPKSQMHEQSSGEGWQRDRKNVTELIDFIDQRDPSRPFFTWMFFESPHARYYFPEESVIRRPYQDDINYATLDRDELRKDIQLIHNRYLNSVHHLDSQYARVLDYLREKQLLDSTIVVLIGDHGEEFMEYGRWGHNSTFNDPQTRAPLVLWIPGLKPAAHDKLTSHMDLPATLMPLLGVTNPPSDYTLGNNLISGPPNEYVVISDWSHIGFRSNLIKVTLPLKAQGGLGKKVTGPNDQMLTADQVKEYFHQEQPKLNQLLEQMGRYTKKGK